MSLVSTQRYEEFDWNTIRQKIKEKNYTEDDWFTRGNTEDIVWVFEKAEDTDDHFREVVKHRHKIDSRFNEWEEDRLRRRVKRIREECIELRDIIKDLTDRLVHFVHQAYNDVNTWFSRSGMSQYEYHEEDMPKRMRNHQRSYLNYIRDVLIETYIDPLLNEETLQDPLEHYTADYLNLIEDFEKSLHSFLSFLRDWGEDMTHDVDLDSDEDPIDTVKDIVVEAGLQNTNGLVEMRSILSKAKEKHATLTEQDIFQLLCKLDSKAEYEYYMFDGINCWNARKDSNILITEDELQRKSVEELKKNNVHAIFAGDFGKNQNDNFDMWTSYESMEVLENAMLTELIDDEAKESAPPELRDVWR